MPLTVAAYLDVARRAAELDCNIPTRLALLPRNFDSAESKGQLLHESSAQTVRVLWRGEGVEETRLEKEGDKFPSVQENAFEWLGPTIFISASLLTENAHLVSVALSVTANYVTDWFKGISGAKKMKLDFVVEKTKKKSYARVRFEGTPEDFQNITKTSLLKILREVQDDEK